MLALKYFGPNVLPLSVMKTTTVLSRKLAFGQEAIQRADVFINVRTHGQKANQLLFDIGLQRREFGAGRFEGRAHRPEEPLWHIVELMRRGGRQVTEERTARPQK